MTHTTKSNREVMKWNPQEHTEINSVRGKGFFEIEKYFIFQKISKEGNNTGNIETIFI